MAVFFAGPLIIIVLLIVLLSAALFVVPQQQAYIIERFGKFLKVQFAGIHIRIPFVDRIAMKTNMRVNQLNVQLETKTLDNVFVTVVASTQFRVNPNDVATAYYELRDPAGQLRSYMEDALRSAIPALSLDDAFARKAVNETQFTYNKGNKPQWARGAVGSTLFTFKQYSISYMELMHRMYTQGGPEGKRAALFALAMLMLMGGAGGLPFMEDAEDVFDAVASRFGYNTSLKQSRKELLNATLGDVLGEFVDKGVSGLPGAPLDVSGRFGMGNLIPATGLLLKKTDHTRDVTELAGPAGDFATRLFQGANQLVAGKPLEAGLTVSPTAARNLAKAADMATSGMYKDAKGKKVIDTDGYDAFIKAVGFQPNDVAKVQEATRVVQRRVAGARLAETEIADEWAKRVFEKDVTAAQWGQQQIRDWNARNEDSPIKIGYQQITKRVREMNKTKAERLAAAAPKEMRAAVKRELQGKP